MILYPKLLSVSFTYDFSLDGAAWRWGAGLRGGGGPGVEASRGWRSLSLGSAHCSTPLRFLLALIPVVSSAQPDAILHTVQCSAPSAKTRPPPRCARLQANHSENTGQGF
uniref:Uncharacterized protein n=1 Tax=Knipowitschia caucasica TaxID=637954 RepID=A0AAV2KZA7_KNICA